MNNLYFGGNALKTLVRKLKGDAWKDSYGRIVTFDPAWDKRSKDPAKNYGIHDVNLRMILTGQLGAVELVVFTGWMLPEIIEESNLKPIHDRYIQAALPANVFVHSYFPLEDSTKSTVNCPYLDRKKCHMINQHRLADEIFEVLLRKGDQGVWKELLKLYNKHLK